MKLPEKIIKLLRSDVREDMLLGMWFALDYADNTIDYRLLIYKVYRIPKRHTPLFVVTGWSSYFDENKPLKDGYRKDNKIDKEP